MTNYFASTWGEVFFMHKTKVFSLNNFCFPLEKLRFSAEETLVFR